MRRFEGTDGAIPSPSARWPRPSPTSAGLLEPVREHADVVVDTAEMNVNQLRQRVTDLFGDDPAMGMRTSVVSFGYKHGLPLDADLVFDCRFLPNPHWVEKLRPLSGLDEPVRDHVMAEDATHDFLDRVDDLVGTLLPAYADEGKAYLTVALGCTGGRHRSVVLAEELARRLRGRGSAPIVVHRDIER